MSPELQQPNILLVFTDQHRLSAVGCYGDTPCRTPSIDALASDGVRFETAYTVCPVCSPARGTIMTGLYPHAHGICSNVQNFGSSVHELRNRPELLSRRLQAAGYRCGYTGKWHLGTDRSSSFHGPNTPSLPKDVGFEGQNFPGHGGGGFMYPEYKAYLESHGFEHKVRKPENARVKGCGVLQGPIESTVPYFLADHTIQLIDRFSKDNDPFFIWHNFWGPHGPYFATQEYLDIYRDVNIPEWPNYNWETHNRNLPLQVKVHPNAETLTWEDWSEAVRHYYAFTTLIDRQIGRILDHLDATGLAENTVVVFTSDHGETLGSHGGLTDKGWHHFEEIQRIPFIVRCPANITWNQQPRGSVLPNWISLADVYPTILDAAGASHDADACHGRSLLPLLNDATIPWRDRIAVEFNGVNNLATTMVSIRKGPLKYGWNCSNRDELYDLEDDPFEMQNRIDDPDYASHLQAMRALLDEWMAETDYPGRQMYAQSRLARYWG